MYFVAKETQKLQTITRHSMATDGDKYCPWCAKDLRTQNWRGQRVHVGMCKVKREEAAAAAAAAAAVAATRVAAPPPRAAKRAILPAVAAEDMNPLPGGLNETDKALLLLYYERTDIKVSLMREIIAIARMPDAPTFRSERELLKTVDLLPGPRFTVYSLTVPPLPATFQLLARDVGEIALGLMQRFNGKICDPQVLRDPASGTTDFVDGERYRELLQTFGAAFPDEEAVLVPLIFNAGQNGVLTAAIGVLTVCY